MSNAWLIWWCVLCAAAVVNITAWCCSAWLLRHRESHLPADVRATRRRLLVLSAVYLAGCGFRSVLPMVDVPRICLHETWVSYIAVGRTVATVAELCFAAQWALLLHEAGAFRGGGLARLVSRILIPLIVTAQLSCWFAVLTTNYLLHAIENALWTLAAALVIAGFVSVWRHVDDKGRRFLAAGIAFGAAYVTFMVFVDVPMYLSRWQAGVVAGHAYLPLREGVREVLERCIVTREWAAWRDDVTWLSLYFTVAVWASIALAHVPPLRGYARRPHA